MAAVTEADAAADGLGSPGRSALAAYRPATWTRPASASERPLLPS